MLPFPHLPLRKEIAMEYVLSPSRVLGATYTIIESRHIIDLYDPGPTGHCYAGTSILVYI